MSMFYISELLDMDPDEATKKLGKTYKKLFGIIFISVAIIVIFIKSVFPSDFTTSIEIIKIALGFVAVFSLYISFVNHCLTRKHKQTSIEMEKKNKAIEMIYKWSLENNTEVLIARKITERLDKAEVAKLSDGYEEVTVSLKDYEMMQPFLPTRRANDIAEVGRNDQMNCDDKTKKADSVEEKHCNECPLSDRKKLTMGETLWLRSNVVKYLNVLEAIMYAWSADIVARDVVEMEFGYLVTRERNGSVVLEEFRKQQGQENYPGIYAFCTEMSKKNEKKIIQQFYHG